MIFQSWSSRVDSILTLLSSKSETTKPKLQCWGNTIKPLSTTGSAGISALPHFLLHDHLAELEEWHVGSELHLIGDGCLLQLVLRRGPTATRWSLQLPQLSPAQGIASATSPNCCPSWTSCPWEEASKGSRMIKVGSVPSTVHFHQLLLEPEVSEVHQYYSIFVLGKASKPCFLPGQGFLGKSEWQLKTHKIHGPSHYRLGISHKQ